MEKDESAVPKSGTATNPASPSPRFIGPDVLRFFAASLVLVRHWGINFDDNQTFIAIFWKVSRGAGLGVDIFFVLSGFLVSGLLFQELKKTGSVSITRFLIRRGFKIYPAYWVMFLSTLIVEIARGACPSQADLWSMVLFFQNYLRAYWHDVPPVWSPTWSLAVEEHFYLLVAGLFWFFKLRARGGRPFPVGIIPSVFFYMAVLCLVLRYVFGEFAGIYYDGEYTKFPSHLRMDSLMFGVLLAYFWHLRWSADFKEALLKWRAAFWVLGICCLLSNFVWCIGERAVTFTWAAVLFYVGSGFLLLASLAIDAARAPALLKFMAWLGRHSYSVYIWHIAVLVYFVLPVKSWGPLPALPGVYFVFFFASCWGIGVLLAKLIEFPSLRLRDRLFPALQKK